MVGLRIQGLVRAARNARSDLRAGFEPEARGAFLARVRRVVHRADEILAAHDCPPGRLPAPSRNALAELRALAALTPEELTAADAGQPNRKRVQLKNVVRTLGACLDRLSEGTMDEASLARVHADARLFADSIEKLCVEQGGHTAGLAAPSRRAYAMLRWLSRRENLDRYAAQVRWTIAQIPRLRHELSLAPQPKPIRVWFRPSGSLFRAGPRKDYYAWEFAIGALAAEEADLRAILCWGLPEHAASKGATARRVAFLRSERYAALQLEIEHLGDPAPYQPRGRAYDLDRLFVKLNATYFGGTLEKPNLDWRPMQSRRTFGLYIASLDLACLNPLLDDPSVPEFVAEAVLYHELLHKKHGVSVRGGRAHAHTPAFKAEERLHPDLAASDQWLAALGTGRPGPLSERPASTPQPSAGRPRASAPEPRPGPERAPQQPLAGSGRPGRNEPCHCGSGQKYKRCHLASDVRPEPLSTEPGT